MDIIYVLIPLALFFIILALKFFFWAVKNGQFEDLEGPAHSILFDDDEPPPKQQTNENQKAKPEDKRQ